MDPRDSEYMVRNLMFGELPSIEDIQAVLIKTPLHETSKYFLPKLKSTKHHNVYESDFNALDHTYRGALKRNKDIVLHITRFVLH